MEKHEEYMKRRAAEQRSVGDVFEDYIAAAEEIDQETIDPPHYNTHAIQPIEYIMANNLPFCEGNVVKYISRWREKNGISDLRKCRQYIDFLIKQEEEGKPL